MLEAAPAIPPKPNTAATNATTKNIIDHLSIIFASFGSILLPPMSKYNQKCNFQYKICLIYLRASKKLSIPINSSFIFSAFKESFSIGQSPD